MEDHAPASFGITYDAQHMAWQFVGQVGHYGDSIPEAMKEPVRRAIALAYYRIELVEGGEVAEMAANLSANALLAAHERLTGYALARDWEATMLHNNTSKLPRAELFDLAAKAMLSASLSQDGVTNGEVFSSERRLLWDFIEHDGEPALLFSAPSE